MTERSEAYADLLDPYTPDSPQAAWPWCFGDQWKIWQTHTYCQLHLPNQTGQLRNDQD
jgi:hypothetical protein